MSKLDDMFVLYEGSLQNFGRVFKFQPYFNLRLRLHGEIEITKNYVRGRGVLLTQWCDCKREGCGFDSH